MPVSVDGAPSATGQRASARRFPLLQGVLPIDRASVPADVVAGVTLAALGIPEVMGYAKIAGMPVVTGLYTILIPIAVFAVLGSSRHLVVGADSATAAILAAGLAGLAATGSPRVRRARRRRGHRDRGLVLVARPPAPARVPGRLLVAQRADRLPHRRRHPGGDGSGRRHARRPRTGAFGPPDRTKFVGTLGNIGDTSMTTLAVSLSVLVVIVGQQAVIDKRSPVRSIAVVGSIVVSWCWDLAHTACRRSARARRPARFGLPDLSWSQVRDPLIGTAGAIFFVILAQSAATSRAYAAQVRGAVRRERRPRRSRR